MQWWRVKHGKINAFARAGVLRGLITQRFVTPFMTGEEGVRTDQHDHLPYFHRLISEVIAQNLGGESQAPIAEQLLDEISVMILAGHETTASGCLDHAARLRLSLYLSPASGAEAN